MKIALRRFGLAVQKTALGFAKKQTSQKIRGVPPHLSIGDHRAALDITIDEVRERMAEAGFRKPSRGTLSAIESGQRGASVEMLEALEEAYGLREGALTTTYEPRRRRQAVSA